MVNIPEAINISEHLIQSCSRIKSDSTQQSPNQIYEASYWMTMFSGFVFTKLFVQTENSLVWIGSKKDSSDQLALKISQRFQNQSSKTIHQENQNKFLAKIKLNGMAKIIQILQSQNYRLMVMNFYENNLEEIWKRLINNKNRYTNYHIQLVIYVFKNILDIVQELHNSGYVHRDLKPDNFLLDNSFNIVLSDFQLVCKELEIDTSLCGTLEYMAPERLSKKRRSQPITRKSDLWALGIILYELLTGQNPYNGHNQHQVFEQICSGHINDDQIPKQAMNLINGILNINSSKRLKIDEIKNHPFLQINLKRQDFKLLIDMRKK